MLSDVHQFRYRAVYSQRDNFLPQHRPYKQYLLVIKSENKENKQSTQEVIPVLQERINGGEREFWNKDETVFPNPKKKIK